jgi:hypothetical protein
MLAVLYHHAVPDAQVDRSAEPAAEMDVVEREAGEGVGAAWSYCDRRDDAVTSVQAARRELGKSRDSACDDGQLPEKVSTSVGHVRRLLSIETRQR